MTVKLSEAGHFTWAEWVRTFSERIAKCPAQDHESDSGAYYRQWIEALEDIVVAADLPSVRTSRRALRKGARHT